MLTIGFMDMTPSQLRAFHLVAEAGSFSAAARDSGLSQPNLSGQVTALEKAYGVRLFDRRGRQVVPTETGRQLQGITTRLFAVQDEAQALLAGEQTLTRGHLRIAADSAHHVVPIMAALKKKAASLTFQLSIDNSAIVLERLLRHEADVAVMAKSVSDPRLFSTRLRSDRVVLFAPRGHALAKRGDAASERPLRARDVFKMPAEVDGFAVVALLRRLRTSPLVKLGESQQQELQQDLQRVQQTCFGSRSQMSEADLRSLAEKWLRAAC